MANQIKSRGVIINQATVRISGGQDKQTYYNLILPDEYIKAVNLQKRIVADSQFFLSSDALYIIINELLKHIVKTLNKIKLKDVNFYGECQNLLFLKKYTRTSEIVSKKMQIALEKPSMYKYVQPEVVEFKLVGIEAALSYLQAKELKNRHLCISISANYLFSRILSLLDKMQFYDVFRISENIRKSFTLSFHGLNQMVQEKKYFIDLKYALETAQERVAQLEESQEKLVEELTFYKQQSEFYMNSYNFLKNKTVETVPPSVNHFKEESLIEEL